MAKHNKKRNVGLLHEQLIRHASRMTVSGDSKSAQKTVAVVTKHFIKDSELLREFKLFSSLIHTQVESEHLAKRIIEESKEASKNHNANELRREKSLLIRDINHNLNEASFYNQKIGKYKIFATVQALLNEWRGANKLSPVEIVKYEKILIEHLTRPSAAEPCKNTPNANPLVLNLMIEKFNKKYSDALTTEQRRILENRLLSNEPEALRLMVEVKERTLSAVNSFYAKNDNDYLSKKKTILIERINNYLPDNTDESVARALSLANLLSELEDTNEQ